jgi:ABC-type multidrug transport system ATPase subunit
MIEIAKALSLDARILVMDEPTASLSGREVERLFDIIRGLKEEEVSIIFISREPGGAIRGSVDRRCLRYLHQLTAGMSSRSRWSQIRVPLRRTCTVARSSGRIGYSRSK